MNVLKSLLLVALLGSSAAAAAKSVEMDVNGLVCAFCAQGVEKKMKAFPAAAGVFVSLEHRLVAVQLKPGLDIPDASLRKAITDSGFKLVAVRRTDASLDEIRARVRARAASAPKAPAGHSHGGAKGDMDGMKHD